MENIIYDITDNDIKWLQKQYSQLFGISIDKETARRKLNSLLRQMELVYQPINTKQIERLGSEV